jgi:hypothetical protein
MLTLVATVALLSFGALAIDSGYMILANAQTQDIADAASQAALIAYRNTGDTQIAEEAALAVVQANEIVGERPDLTSLTFGIWDDTEDNPVFEPSQVNINAAAALVGRRADNPLNLLMSRIWGYSTFETRGRAVSASRSAQIIIVLDITGSWGERDFAGARAAVLNAADLLAVSASPMDRVGMSIFTNRFAWEYTPLSQISDPDVADEIRDDWELLALASKAGTDADHTDNRECTLHTATARLNDFTNPPGGCYDAMPREYRDEPGTDHSTGLRLAQLMFEDTDLPAAYRAMIVITDGRPAALGAASGNTRAAQGYVEQRWREFRGPVPRTIGQVRAAATNATDEMWDELNVHTWVISFVADDSLMTAMVHGDGYYVRTTQASRINAILTQIIRELPLAIVE